MKLELTNELVQKMSLTKVPMLGAPFDDWLPTDKPNYLVYDTSRKAPPGFAVRVGARASVYLVEKMVRGKKLKIDVGLAKGIYQSLKRRREKLKRRIEEEKIKQRGGKVTASEIFADQASENIWESEDDMAPEDYENFEEEVVDQATAAQTIAELEAEVFTLEHLEKKSKALRDGGQDRKWEELREILQNTPEMRGPDGLQPRLFIRTRDDGEAVWSRVRSPWPVPWTPKPRPK